MPTVLTTTLVVSHSGGEWLRREVHRFRPPSGVADPVRGHRSGDPPMFCDRHYGPRPFGEVCFSPPAQTGGSGKRERAAAAGMTFEMSRMAAGYIRYARDGDSR